MTPAALLLATLLAAPPAPPTRVLLLPADGAAARAVADALAPRLAALPQVTLLAPEALTGLAAPKADDALSGEIDRALKGVQDAYRRLDLDEATRLLQSLENARLSELGCPERIGLAAKISFWLGVVSAAHKDPVHAAERFSTVLSIAPDHPIDRAYFPPQTVALFEQVRKTLSAAPTGGLSLSADPAAAEVFLDGRRAGQAPVTVTASAGDHFVCARRVGWRDVAARLRLSAGKVDTQALYLQRASPEEATRQLAALLGGRPARLDEPAHVEALGATLGADVVLELRPPSTLAWRSARAAAEPHQVSAGPEATSPEQVAAALAAALGQALGVQPPAPVEPVEPAAPSSRFELHAALSTDVQLTFGHGVMLGARVGGYWNVQPFLALGVRAGFGKFAGDVGFVQVPVAGPIHPVIGLANGGVDLPLSLEVRLHVVRTPKFRLSAWAGATVRLDTYGPPLPGPTAPNVAEIVPAAPLALGLLGPHGGLVAGYTVHSRVNVVLGVEYGYELLLGRPALTASLRPSGTLQLAPELARHLLSFDLGVLVRFD